ncbi:MAG: MGH1-like glycoside hydrolase domain-containing protein [Povalibacter sp.]
MSAAVRAWLTKALSHTVGISMLLLFAALEPAVTSAADAQEQPARNPDPLNWSTDSTQSRFIAVHGRRAAVFGYSENGLEVWTYPVQVTESYNVSFLQQHATTEIEGHNVLRRIEYTPFAVTRTYVGPDFIVREKLFVPIDAASAVVTYEVDGARPVDIIVRFTPVLNLMWPAGIGGQEAAWSPAISGYLLSEPLHRYTAVVASPDIVAHDEIPNATRQLGASRQIAFTVRASTDHVAQVAFSGTSSGEDVAGLANELLRNRIALEKSAIDHYNEVLSAGLKIETPDAEVNRALAWSQVALEQAWVCNPDLGCGQVAGYGPSRTARRPQYAWFFAGDGMVAMHALLAEGRYERAREELEFILKFQDPKTGMIWHELSQSAGALPWEKYPYMFVHVDLSFDFLNAVAEYYSITGDVAFVKKHWNAIQSAYRYCRTLLDSKDGLPRIPSDKQGFNEQDPLADELSLSLSWVAAAESFATLATASGQKSAAGSALDESKRARASVNARYWDESRHFWISGHTRAGAPVMDRDIRPMAAIEQTLFTAEQRNTVLDAIAGSDFQTNWGTRGKAETDPTYDPNLYASGSVWALATSTVVTAFWAEHRPATAFPIWNALVSWSSLDSLGHMHETLAGDFYHEEVESVPEQTWSSASFLTATTQGLLGLRVDGAKRHIAFAPHLPASWDRISLRRIRVAGSDVSLEMTRSAEEITLRVKNEGDSVTLSFDPELPLGAKVRTARIENRELQASTVEHAQDTHAHLDIDVPHGDALLQISYSGGVAIVPVITPPIIGAPSAGMKIVSTRLKDRALTLELDHLASESTHFDLRTPWKIANVEGATFAPGTGSSYVVSIKPSSSNEKARYRRSKVIVNFANQD